MGSFEQKGTKGTKVRLVGLGDVFDRMHSDI